MGKRLDDRSPYYYRDSWVDDVTKFAHRPYSSLAIAVNGAHLRRRFTVTVCGSCSGLVLSDRVNNDSLIDTVTQGEYHQRPEQNTRIKNNEILLPLNFDISRFNVIGSFVTRGLREGDFKSINTMESRQVLIIWIFTFSSRTRASYTNAQTTRRVSGIRRFVLDLYSCEKIRFSFDVWKIELSDNKILIFFLQFPKHAVGGYYQRIK